MVECPYLFCVLDKFGFSTVFIDLIKSPYKSPKARIITNGITSNPFHLNRGNRQGCPSGPALFVLTIEPLTEAIRGNPHVGGFEVGPKTHKISLFTDDIILYLAN